ncbi:MAG: hypothetical protein CMC81_05870 [Flavobacteriaceae bacterium]|nr:hypothetical protein [Flavobacteriaceae bacterium]
MKLLVSLLVGFNIFLSEKNITKEDHKSLNDSISKYIEINPNKALDFGFEILKLVDSQNPDRQLVSTYNLIGELLTNRKLYAEALSYFSEAIKSFNLLDEERFNYEKNINAPPWVLINISNLYFAIGEIENAKLKVKEAESNFLLYNDDRKKEIGLNTVNGNLGLFSSYDKDYKTALKLYLKVLNSRKRINDTDGEMYSYAQLVDASLNLGDLFQANEYYNKASILYNKLKTTTPSLKSSYLQRNYAYIFLVFGQKFFLDNEFNNALDYLNNSKKFLSEFTDELPYIDSMISKCFLGLNDYKNAETSAINNLSREKLTIDQKKANYIVLENVYKQTGDINNLIKVKDSLIKMSSISNVLNVGGAFSKLETQILLAKKQSELNESKIRYNTYLYILIIGSVVLIFSLITIRINYNYQKEKNSRLEIEQNITQSILEKKQLELVSKTNFIAQRNEYLDSLKKSIKKIRKEKKSNADLSQGIEKDIDKIIGSEKIFKNFESQFTEVYPDFFKILVKRYGKLSQNDLRLCAYIKMNQTTNQISQITGVSIRTVETQRYRLSKKLKLGESEDLNSTIISI